MTGQKENRTAHAPADELESERTSSLPVTSQKTVGTKKKLEETIGIKALPVKMKFGTVSAWAIGTDLFAKDPYEKERKAA